MSRNDDSSTRSSSPMPSYDDQGDMTNMDELSPEERETLGLNEQEDDEAL